MHNPYLKQSHPTMYIFVQSASSLPLMVGDRSCFDKQEVRYHASLNSSHLHYGCQRSTLAVAQHCHAMLFTYWGYLLSARGRSIFGKYLNTHLKFTVYGRKHGRSYTHTSAQCSPASVGLTQAHPNKCLWLVATPRAWLAENLQIVGKSYNSERLQSQDPDQPRYHFLFLQAGSILYSIVTRSATTCWTNK